MGKATPVTKRDNKKSPLFDNRLELQRDGYSVSALEKLEARYRRNLQQQKEKVAREIKSVYDSRDRELKSEIEALQKLIKSEVNQLVKASHNLHRQTSITISQPIANPGKYHIGFLKTIRTVIEKIIKARKNIDESSHWLEACNQKGRKKGLFWNTFTGKKAGSKFLLSPEHYLTRSAG